MTGLWQLNLPALVLRAAVTVQVRAPPLLPRRGDAAQPVGRLQLRYEGRPAQTVASSR